jgi:predicted ATP-dependent serine protease
MGARGLVEVEDPSLVSWRDIVGDPGVSACVCAHLAKPVLVPVEALVSPDDAGSGARSIQATGVAIDRVRFVLEAMTRHSGVSFSKVTVRVRVPQVAGEDVSDSALDLAIGAACWSSLTNTSLGGLVLWGAIGLSGKIQSVSRIDSRVEYAERVRASSIVAGHPKSKTPAARLPVLAVSHVADLVGAIDLMRGRSEHDRQEEARREPARREPARYEEAPDASPF